jgi:DNA-binding NtrC family response regulator
LEENLIGHIEDLIRGELKNYQVSLALIFDRQGNILWKYGREITGTHILDCTVICISAANRCIQETREIFWGPNMITAVNVPALSESTRFPKPKSVLVLPVDDGFYLYVDSSVRTGFNEREIGNLEALGRILEIILARIRQTGKGKNEFYGTSEASQKIRAAIARYAMEAEPVLLSGETGTGKNHIASLIHLHSGRRGPFIVCHCPSIPETLFESELFGHRKGSFTGADREKPGLAEAASGGTLFLDEISEIPFGFQAKLLRFIENRHYRRVGDTVERQADVRILAASNRDLATEIQRRRFREDLFFRLCIFSIYAPPLRERPEDISVLIKENRDLLRGKSISETGMERLLNHDWPGNVRELITVLKRIGIECMHSAIGSEVAAKLTLNESKQYERNENKKVDNDKIDLIWKQLQAGMNFWEAVKKPYMKRELNRNEVKMILSRGLNKCDGKYIKVLKSFNLEEEEYHRFMSFLNSNGLQNKS